MKRTRIRQNRPSDGVNGTLPGGGDQYHGVCEVCLKPLRAEKRETKRFCSSRCRLLSWTVDALAKALRDGKAEGLRDKANETARLLNVKVIQVQNDREPFKVNVIQVRNDGGQLEHH